ncbi:MAG: hypothetical protein AB1546_11570 [bacterium]
MRTRKTSIILIQTFIVLTVMGTISLIEKPKKVFAYPPAVGIVGEAKTCLDCHVNNGPWKDERYNIVDVFDKDTKKSVRQSDGTLVITAKRGKKKTVLTVLGRSKGDKEAPPYRTAWLYIDPKTIGGDSLSKFAPGWEVNLPMGCRIVGDTLEGLEDDNITVLPMTIRPTASAKDTEITLQVMLTKGESVKGKPKEGMIGNYFERTIKLKVVN